MLCGESWAWTVVRKTGRVIGSSRCRGEFSRRGVFAVDSVLRRCNVGVVVVWSCGVVGVRWCGGAVSSCGGAIVRRSGWAAVRLFGDAVSWCGSVGVWSRGGVVVLSCRRVVVSSGESVVSWCGSVKTWR